MRNNDAQDATPAAVAMNRALAGRCAVITGSTSGIGLGIAEALGAAGADLVINGLGDGATIETLRADLANRHGVNVHFVGSNLMEASGVEDLIAQSKAALGQIDILVNNAGIQFVSPIETFPTERWNAIIALNLSASFHAMRAVFADMKARKFGRIINVASAHGLVASPFKSAYVAAKHGVVGLTKSVALEGAEHGVTVNAICPGYVWTPLVEKQIGEQAEAHGISREAVIRDVLLAAQPNKKFATVAEIGALAAFLSGDNGASITGAALAVDGGWTAH
ncbi:FabG Dehydrogenases with different specificities (related to short-chain alcohol dehydrogenases) [Rhabdaerophilaceae bacterium]